MSESSVIQISDFDEHFKSVPPLQAMNFDLGAGRSLSVDCLRLDKVHPFISGNKWYKLKYHIQAASLAGKSRLLSFGGAHSNHLHALAFAGKKLQFQTIGVVRGEAPKVLTPTLQDCVDWGMSLQWLSRRDYRNIAPLECINDYSKKFISNEELRTRIGFQYRNQFSDNGLIELRHDQHLNWQHNAVLFLNRQNIKVSANRVIQDNQHRKYKQKFGAALR